MVRDYRETRERFNAFKMSIVERERGHCQHCGKTYGLMIYFKDEESKQKMKAENAILLCRGCYDVALSVNRILKAQEAYKTRGKR